MQCVHLSGLPIMESKVVLHQPFQMYFFVETKLNGGLDCRHASNLRNSSVKAFFLFDDIVSGDRFYLIVSGDRNKVKLWLRIFRV
jgi:hypothetical protein